MYGATWPACEEYSVSFHFSSTLLDNPWLKKVTPLYVKRGSVNSLSWGRSLIFWLEHLLRSLRHVTQIRLYTAELHPIIQNPLDLISLVVRDRPWCLMRWWKFRMMSSIIWNFLGRIIGCLVLKSNSPFWILPPIGIIPCHQGTGQFCRLVTHGQLQISF